MNPNVDDNDSEDFSWDEELIEDGETYFMCVGTCNRVMHYEDTNGEGVCGRCEEEYIKINYQSSDEEEDFHDKVNIEEEEMNDSDEEEEFPPIPPPIQRQTTQWIVDGKVVFNGNPNGDRLLSYTTDADGNLTKEYLEFVETFCMVDTEMTFDICRAIYDEIYAEINK